jgi:hypothetical protein
MSWGSWRMWISPNLSVIWQPEGRKIRRGILAFPPQLAGRIMPCLGAAITGVAFIRPVVRRALAACVLACTAAWTEPFCRNYAINAPGRYPVRRKSALLATPPRKGCLSE